MLLVLHVLNGRLTCQTIMLKFFITVGPIYLSSHYTKKILVCIVLDNNLIQRMSYKFILSYIYSLLAKVKRMSLPKETVGSSFLNTVFHNPIVEQQKNVVVVHAGGVVGVGCLGGWWLNKA